MQISDPFNGVATRNVPQRTKLRDSQKVSNLVQMCHGLTSQQRGDNRGQEYEVDDAHPHHALATAENVPG